MLDCDGVILDSNQIKSDAFHAVAVHYGEQYARQLVDYHKKNGGISRFEKMEFFVSNILKKKANRREIERLIEAYGKICLQKLLKCKQTPMANEFFEALPENVKRYVVSGGRYDELEYVFEQRKLNCFFDGIYGSPESKTEILSRLTKENCLPKPAVLVGDSKYDYIAAKSIGADFIFMSDFTEFENWHEFFEDKNILHIGNLSELLTMLKQPVLCK